MTAKKTIFGAVILLTVASNLGAAKIVERIIARINSEIITQRQFEREQQRLRAQLAQDYSGAELEGQFHEQIKRNLLMREVIGREVGSRIQISHEDARKYFKEHQQEFASPEGVHLAEILISADKH